LERQLKKGEADR
jgi:hypothetical protein